MNVYDFDGTLYSGDSTFDFMRWLMKRYPKVLARLPYIAKEFARYRMKKQTKTVFKEKLYRVFTLVPDMESEVALFWESHLKKLKNYYQTTKKADDMVISASAEFLILPACETLGIQRVLGSVVDMKTGKYTGVNCHGEEKIRRLREVTQEKVDEFYSDSHADDPLAGIAEKAWMVKGEKLVKWPFRK